MSKDLKNINEIINKNKKKIITGISTFVAAVIILGGAITTVIYSKAKSNINYTVDQAKEIALQAVEGEVLKVNKTLELERFSFEYEFKIKDSNNILKEVTVDSNLGVITDIDNYYD